MEPIKPDPAKDLSLSESESDSACNAENLTDFLPRRSSLFFPVNQGAKEIMPDEHMRSVRFCLHLCWSFDEGGVWVREGLKCLIRVSKYILCLG